VDATRISLFPDNSPCLLPSRSVFYFLGEHVSLVFPYEVSCMTGDRLRLASMEACEPLCSSLSPLGPKDALIAPPPYIRSDSIGLFSLFLCLTLSTCIFSSLKLFEPLSAASNYAEAFVSTI